MRRQTAILLSLLIFTATFIACNSDMHRHLPTAEEWQEWTDPNCTVDADLVLKELKNSVAAWPTPMYADNYTQQYYQQHPSSIIWISRMGVDERADTLLEWLSQAEDLGFSPEVFHVDTLQILIHQLRSQEFGQENCNTILGRIEFLLTRAYLRYACGQRYGFINPNRTFNHLLVDQPASGEKSRGVTYRRIYDMGTEEASDSFVNVALDKARHHQISAFLRDIQPTDTLYSIMQREYTRVKATDDTIRRRQARINMERARWRYPHPSTDRYIFVNLAAQQLTAVDKQKDSVLTMRVCCGNASHKTPLLHSSIGHVELNPYWVIPQTIVRKEIMPRHVGDSAYYARNKYHAVNKETKEIVDPATLSAADLRSARYTLRQERGAGNSLGRIIFRFPNNFSVYLHDTNNHSAFSYGNRAISHGCVRVEKPLDLALFFLENPTPFFIDRIRMAIDLSPLTAQGRQYKAAHPDATPLGRFTYDNPIPLWLDYWTLYPTPYGSLEAYPDNYGYDRVIQKIFDSY